MSKLIIFDCDGTLVDSEIIAAKIFPAMWSSMGVEMTTDYFLCNFVGTGSDSEVGQKTLALLPPNAMEVADQAFDKEIAVSLQAVQGIQELLRELTYSSCVASNSSLKYVKNALSKTHLTEFFGDKVFSSRDIGRPKPAPDVFLHAAKVMGFDPKDCLVVEDSVSGINAAKNAGMQDVGFMGGLHFNRVVKERLLSASADFYCSSSTELKNTLFSLSN